jgi:hypothetical protein
MRKLFVVRRVVGGSMLPSLWPGRVVFGWGPARLRVGDIVILSHEGMEKIKRIHQIKGEQLYLTGDNAPASTDSRHFGWIHRKQVLARIVWPHNSLDRATSSI